MRNWRWKQKRYWMFVIFLLALPMGYWAYTRTQEDTTWQAMQQELTNWQRSNDMVKSYLRQLQEYGEGVQNFETYNDLLDQSYRAMKEWQKALLSKQGDSVVEEIQTYELFQDLRRLPENLPVNVLSEQSLNVRLAKARQLQQYGLMHLKEKYPDWNALFLEKVTHILWNGWTVAFILISFGYWIYSDLERGKLEAQLCLPLTRKKVLSQYPLAVLIGASVLVLSVMMIGISIVVMGRGNSFNYPYIVQRLQAVAIYPVWQILLFRLVMWLSAVLLGFSLIQILFTWLATVELNMVVGILMCMVASWVEINGGWYTLRYFNNGEQLLVSSREWSGCIRFVVVAWGVFLIINMSHLWVKMVEYRRQRYIIHPKISHHWWEMSGSQWLGFEYLKKIRQPMVKKGLAGIVIVLLSCYAYTSVKSMQWLETFQQSLHTREEIRQYNDTMNELVRLSALEEMKMHRLEDYEQRADLSQSFESWLEQEEPENYHSMMRAFNQLTAEKILYKETLDLIQRQEFTKESLMNFRERYYAIQHQFEIDHENQRQFANKLLLAAEQENIWVKQNGASVITGGEVLRDQHDHVEEAFPGYEASQQRWSHSFLYSFWSLVQHRVWLLIVCVGVVVLGASFSEEQTPVNHMDGMFVIPWKRHTIFWHKVRYNSVMVITLWSMIVSGYLVVSFCLGGFGEWEYPIVQYVPEQIGKGVDFSGWYAKAEKWYIQFQPLGNIVIQAWVVLLAAMYTFSHLVLCISIWVKQRYVTMMISMGSILSVYYVSIQHLDWQGIRWSPFLYIDVENVVNGWFAMQANDSRLNAWWGVALLLGTSCALCLLARFGYAMKWEKKVIR